MSNIISSISVSPNRDIVTKEILDQYVDRVIPYLNANCDRYVMSLEKGSRDFENHIQIVCESKYKPSIMKQYFDRKLADLPGYYKGAKGIKDGSTVCAVNRTKNGEAMFGYPMKEHPDSVFKKGISEQQLQEFCAGFANLPDYKRRRNSTRADGVAKLIDLLWQKLLYYKVKNSYYYKDSNIQKINRYLKHVYNITDSSSTSTSTTCNTSETEETEFSS